MKKIIFIVFILFTSCKTGEKSNIIKGTGKQNSDLEAVFYVISDSIFNKKLRINNNLPHRTPCMKILLINKSKKNKRVYFRKIQLVNDEKLKYLADKGNNRYFYKNTPVLRDVADDYNENYDFIELRPNDFDIFYVLLIYGTQNQRPDKLEIDSVAIDLYGQIESNTIFCSKSNICY